MESSAMLMDGVVIRSALWRYRIGFGMSGIGRSFVRGREPVGRSSSADKIASHGSSNKSRTSTGMVAQMPICSLEVDVIARFSTPRQACRGLCIHSVESCVSSSRRGGTQWST